MDLQGLPDVVDVWCDNDRGTYNTMMLDKKMYMQVWYICLSSALQVIGGNARVDRLRSMEIRRS